MARVAPYLEKDRGSYLFVLRVPKEARPIFGKAVIKHSVGTVKKVTLEEAARQALALKERYELVWAAAAQEQREKAESFAEKARRFARSAKFGGYRTASDLAANDTFEDLMERAVVAYRAAGGGADLGDPAKRTNAVMRIYGALGGVEDEGEGASPKSTTFAGFPTIQEVFQKDMIDHPFTKHGNPRNEKMIGESVAMLIEAVGDIPMIELNRQHAIAFRRHVLGKKNNRGRSNGAATFNRRLSDIQPIWDRWAEGEEGAAPRNPFEKLRVSEGSGKDKVVPFHQAHLEIIDLIPADTKAGAQIALLRATGIGHKELLAIDPARDLVAAPVPHLVLRPERIGLKDNDHRARRIPLLGIDIETARRALFTDNELWAEVRRIQEMHGKGGKKTSEQVAIKQIGTNLSANITARLRAAGVPKSDRLIPYSFRHGWKQAYRDAPEVDEWLGGRLMGHNGEAGAPGKYGSPRARLKAKRDAMLAAQRHLGRPEPSIYKAAELPGALKARADALEAEWEAEEGAAANA